MKHLTFIILSILVFSCSKENYETTNDNPTAQINKFFKDGAAVDSSTIFSDTSLVVYCVGDENTITYAFTSEEKEIEWLKTQPFGNKVLESLKMAEELQSLAKKTGAITEFETTGEVPLQFMAEMNKRLTSEIKSTEITGLFYDGIFTGSTVPATTYPWIPGWDNKLTSAYSLSLGFHFYRHSFFRQRFYTWIIADFIHGPKIHFANSDWDNITSSTFNF